MRMQTQQSEVSAGRRKMSPARKRKIAWYGLLGMLAMAFVLPLA
ncbi:MAG: hypothetical protein ACI8UP_003463, partial [Porticoccaceae bacterium]